METFEQIVARQRAEDVEFFEALANTPVETTPGTISFDDNFLSDDYIAEMISEAAKEQPDSSYFSPAVKTVSDSDGNKYSRKADLAFLLSGKAPAIVVRKGPRGTTRTINTAELREKYERSFYAEVLAFMNDNKNLYSDEIALAFSDHHVAEAFGKKRPERYVAKVVSNIEEWLFFKNCVRPFESLLQLSHDCMTSKKLQRDSKTQFPAMAAIISMQQAKDNSKLGLMSLRYITRLCTLLVCEFSVKETDMRKRLEQYSKKEFIQFSKGEVHGVASRAALVPTEMTLSQDEKRAAADYILASFKDSEIKTHLSILLNALVEQDEPTSYKNEEMVNRVQTLISAFYKVSKEIADARVFEYHAEKMAYLEEKVKRELEIEARVTAHINSGLGFQPRMYSPEGAVAVMEPETIVEASESHVDELIETILSPVALPVYPNYRSFSEASEFRAAQKNYIAQKRAYDWSHIADGIDF